MIVVAKIGGAHGLAGEVRVRFFSDAPDDCCARGPLYPADDPDCRPLSIRSFRHGSNAVIIGFEGVHDRTAAEKLNGTLLYQSRELFPETADDEYYYTDLIGMSVFSEDRQTSYGTIEDVFSNGASDILVVRGMDGQVIHIPFIAAAVPSVDRDARKVFVIPDFIP